MQIKNYDSLTSTIKFYRLKKMFVFYIKIV